MPDDPEPFERMEPHDLRAEQAYTGALVLADQKSKRAILQLLAGADFYRPAHETIHTAVGRMLDAGQAVDPITLTAHLQESGDLARIGGAAYLHTCVTAVPTVANADWYADRIKRLALRRALIHTGQQITQMGFDPEGDPAILAETAVSMARDVRDAGRAADDTPVLDMWDFLAEDLSAHDWVVPGFLERMDRVIWTAGEGGGKSVWQRQLAVTAAAGCTPLGDIHEYGPAKVLVLDCENSPRQSQRHYRALMNIAERQHTRVKRGQLHIDLRPEGVDLTRPEGRSWLMRRVEQVMPDLLIVGPIYRLHNGDPNSEEHARRITVVLDEARVTANCAMSLEAHSPQGNGFGPRALRPVGSSLWLRWPEFGLGFRPVEDERTAHDDRGRRVIPWRGARDERNWPTFLCQGHEGGWPWRSYRPIDADPYTGHSSTGALS
jgi:replicative DNA helicase